jgi:lysozyme
MNHTRAMIATLTLSAAGFLGIVGYESFRDTAYNDGVGVSTIGFGTTTGVKPGDRITVTEALARIKGDLTAAERALKRCVTVPLYQHEFDAYTSFIYNVGQTAFCGSTLVKRLNAGDYAGACAQLSRWIYAKGKKPGGLVKRRAAERALCEGRA